MKKAQESIAKFNLERGWEKDDKIIKDFLLNLCEECGEAWNIIKWVDGTVLDSVFQVNVSGVHL